MRVPRGSPCSFKRTGAGSPHRIYETATRACLLLCAGSTDNVGTALTEHTHGFEAEAGVASGDEGGLAGELPPGGNFSTFDGVLPIDGENRVSYWGNHRYSR